MKAIYVSDAQVTEARVKVDRADKTHRYVDDTTRQIADANEDAIDHTGEALAHLEQAADAYAEYDAYKTRLGGPEITAHNAVMYHLARAQIAASLAIADALSHTQHVFR